MDVDVWVRFGLFALSVGGVLVAIVRYFDKQIADKISIGEYDRRHEDLERRLREVEKWQARANGIFDRAQVWRNHDNK